MGDSNRVQISYAKETTFGVSPTGAYKTLRQTGDTLGQDQQTVESAEIRSDRQISGVKRTSINTSGDLSLEFSADTYDDLILASLMASAFSTKKVAEGNIGAAEVSNTFTIAADPLFAEFVPGQWVKSAGFTNPANNGYFKILSVAGNNLSIVVDGELETEDGAVGRTITMGQYAINGTTKSSFTIERKYADLTNEFALYKGSMVEQLGLSLALGQIITGTLNFVGKQEVSATAAVGSSYVAATTTEVMNTVDDITTILEGGAVLDISQLSLQIKNNLRGKQKLGALGSFDIGAGTFNVTGTLTAFYASKTLIEKYLNQTQTSIMFVLTDLAGNAYLFELPAVKLTTGKRQGGTLNSDVMSECSFTAYRSATAGYTLKVAKFS